MKNELKLIIYQILLCIFSFLINWYGDNIMARFTPFVVIILRLALLVIFLKLSFLVIHHFGTKKLLFKGINILFMIITLLVNIYNFRLIKTKLELQLFDNERKTIIEKVINNEFAYYYEGNIKLPNYKYVSSDGEIYVYQNDYDQVIGFWIFRGLQSGSVQLIYSSKDEELIYKNKLSINKIIKLKKHWYYVITDY